ncbi:hypothetical protein [Paenibacillus aquistagni]|uniref:hypothetical protein n=1 Tax=Paenibacillus aquistagni TaxID=1852522 RepID=UPI000B50CD8E|nr:hypothetical protein [Paenibacillus aquistagni]
MKRLVLLMFCLFTLVSCSSKQEKFDKYELPMAKDGQGYSFGLFNKDKIEPSRSFTLDGQTTFTKSLVFGNKVPQDTKLMLVVFDKGQQVNFNIKGKSYNYYPFTVNAEEYCSIEVMLENIDESFHSINYILFRDPDYIRNESDELKKSIKLTQLFSIRVNINEEKMENKHSKNASIASYPYPRIHGVFTSKGNELYKAWTNERVGEGQEYLSYNLLYGNTEQSPMDFFIVTLLNWKQINMNGNKYIYDQLEPFEEKNLGIQINEEFGEINHLVTILLPDPYGALPDENPYSIFSPSSSIRTAVIKE